MSLDKETKQMITDLHGLFKPMMVSILYIKRKQ